MIKKPLHILLLILVLFNTTFAQDLYKSRRTGYYSYIFRIDTEQMKILVSEPYTRIDTIWFSNPVDSFLTGTRYTGLLPPGDYMMATLESNSVRLSVLQQPPFHPVVLDNNTDLIVKVISSARQNIHDAELRIGNREIPFDTVIQAYRLPYGAIGDTRGEAWRACLILQSKSQSQVPTPAPRSGHGSKPTTTADYMDSCQECHQHSPRRGKIDFMG